MTSLTLPWSENDSPRDLIRWAMAAGIVLGIHAAAVGAYVLWHAPEQIGDEASVVTVELAPIDSTPDAVQRDVAPAPETMIESKAVPTPEEEKPQEELKVEQPPEETPTPIPTPVEKPPPKIEAARPPAPRTAQQAKGGAPRIERSWLGRLDRHLNRFKRYPSEAQSHNEQGVVLLGFSLDRTGHVLAHRVVRSSGYADLDDEVMEMIMRAEPLPAFPPSMRQAQIDLTVPIRFSLR